MKQFIGLLLVVILFNCRPPWLAQGAHFETEAGHADTLFAHICKYHNDRFPDDRVKIVYGVSIDQQGFFIPTTRTKVTVNEKGLIRPTQSNSGIFFPLESWVVGTNKGNKFEYHILVGNNSRLASPLSTAQEITYNYQIINFVKLIN